MKKKVASKHPENIEDLTATINEVWAKETDKDVCHRLVKSLLTQLVIIIQNNTIPDNGKEFENTLFRELCRGLNILKLRPTMYQSRSNGCIEQWHRSLNAMLGMVVQTHQTDQPTHVPYMVKLENIHNHAVSNAASLAYLRLTDDIRQSFEEHFNNGLAVADAMRHHVNSLMLGDVIDEQKLAKTPITAPGSEATSATSITNDIPEQESTPRTPGGVDHTLQSPAMAADLLAHQLTPCLALQQEEEAIRLAIWMAVETGRQLLGSF